MAKGRYTLSFDELKEKFNLSNKALLQNIFRLKKKNMLTQVRKGFYIIIPPQYSIRGMIPPTMFIDDLMNYLQKNYYIGLLSAATLHGASGQQPMEFQVITHKNSLRVIKNKKFVIKFFIKSNWKQDHIIKLKTETGFINVSTPELTAFDLVGYHKQIGGINRIVPTIKNLADEIKVSQLYKVGRFQSSPNIQRFGYILDELGITNLSKSVYKLIEITKLRKVVLSLSHENKSGILDDKWKIIKNTEVENL